MIIVEGLTKRRGSLLVLNGIGFRVEPGEALAFWGPNGAGKTTTLKALLGLIQFDGTVRVGGFDPRIDPVAVRRLIGYVPQELPADDRTVGGTLALYAALRRLSAFEAEQALALAGFSEGLSRRIQTLSGGQRQRLALALALLGDPPILLLDEPSANLDEQGRRDLAHLLVGLRREGKCLVITSHRAEEIARVADRVLLLEDGRARVSAGTEEVVRLCQSGS